MKIVITLPIFIPNEADAIVCLFDERGIDRLHLRKPEATEGEVEALLRQIPPLLYPRISIHDHFALAQRYHLGGIHLNSRHPVPPASWQGMISTSCHSIEELARRKQEGIVVPNADSARPFDYLSLSPIFDSISKQGYLAAFTPEDLAAARQQGIIDHRVLALGGVTFARITEVIAMGFGGGMILGDAWR